MQKKKVLILMKTMNIGGAERSLLGLLNAFNYELYDVSLMLYRHEGEFLSYVPKEIMLLEKNQKYSTMEAPIKSLLLSPYFFYGLAKLLAKIEFLFIEKWINKKRESSWIKQQYTHKYLTPLLPNIEGKYDLAINFLGISDILVKKVNAKVKIGWIHTDYNQLVVHKSMDIAVYSKLDYIANVSEDCQRVFLEHYPQFKNKAIVLENVLSKRLIEEQSNLFDVESEISKTEDYINILSIGRFGKAKNFDNIPEICSLIVKKGIKVKWYIIGYGSDEKLIQQKINEFNMQDTVIILGKKENPYPYIKRCDVYAQPSRYEGKAVTVREAQILNKPVIITDYETANCQLMNGIDGIIVPMDNQGCSDGISKVIKSKKILQNIINATENNNYSNEYEVNKIYSLLNKGTIK